MLVLESWVVVRVGRWVWVRSVSSFNYQSFSDNDNGTVMIYGGKYVEMSELSMQQKLASLILREMLL